MIYLNVIDVILPDIEPHIKNGIFKLKVEYVLLSKHGNPYTISVEPIP